MHQLFHTASHITLTRPKHVNRVLHHANLNMIIQVLIHPALSIPHYKHIATDSHMTLLLKILSLKNSTCLQWERLPQIIIITTHPMTGKVCLC